MEEKTRQNAENKQTFDLTAKIEIEEKTRQTSDLIGNDEKLKLREKFVKTLKINKLLL